MGKDTPAQAEPLLTRYYVYLTEDEGATLHLVGEALARGSDEALRKFFADPPVEREPGFFVAVSENARRIRSVKATVKTTIGEVKASPGNVTVNNATVHNTTAESLPV